MPIDRESAKSDWQSGAKAKVDKLVREYTKRTDKLARATSPEAQKAYVEGVTDPTSQKLRLLRLKELTEDELNRAMEAKGRTAYPTGIDASVDKYAKHVEPYFSEIESIVTKLKPRTRDARTNVTERVIPLAVGLQNKKKAIIGK
jgi:hypothetical protein